MRRVQNSSAHWAVPFLSLCRHPYSPNHKYDAYPLPGFGGAAANAITRPNPKQALAAASGPNSGPFGYTEKGTFFIDSHYNGFPESIDLVYQGFVWAFTMNYPDQPSVLHGGVHTILLDKVLHRDICQYVIIFLEITINNKHGRDHQVKKETIPLAGDYIVRVTGRASPYNINRLTLYTKQGDLGDDA